MILRLINLEVVGLNPLQAEYSQWSWEHRAFPRMVVVVAGRRIPMVKCYSQNLESVREERHAVVQFFNLLWFMA